MDEIVKQALAKWPDVPACTGWLLLDRRGVWRMRDEAAQSANHGGVPIRHAALISFINRNYSADSSGQWFFQNGPQRVYVELAYAPWVVRLHETSSEAGDGARGTHGIRTLSLIDQTGRPFDAAGCWLDETGSVLFADTSTPPRVALLHDHDLDLFSEHFTTEMREGQNRDSFHWRDGALLPVQPIAAADVPRHFGFVQSPARQARAA